MAGTRDTNGGGGAGGDAAASRAPASGSAPARRWLLRLTVVLGSSLLVLGLAEVVARVALAPPWYLAPRPTAVRPHPQVHRAGRVREQLRAPLLLPRPAPACRVLVLGDSFTYGNGLRDPARTFVRQLEARLAAAARSAREEPCVVFNGGTPGSLTRDWIDLFEGASPELAPQVVIAVFFLRDGQLATGSLASIRKIRAEMRARYEGSLLARSSALYRFFRQRSWQRELGMKYLAAMRAGYLGPPEQRREWKRAQINLLRLRDDAERRGATFGLVVFPVLFELGDRYPMRDVVEEIEAFARLHRIRSFSLLPAFAGRRASTLWVSPTDQHPNELGHDIAAAAMYPFVADLAGRARRRPAGAPATAPATAPSGPEAPASAGFAAPSTARTPPPAGRVLEERLQAVAAALHDPARALRGVRDLGRLGPAGAPLTRELLGVMSGDDLLLRRRGIAVIRSMGRASLDDLAQGLADPGEAAAACRAVRALGPAAATPRILDVLVERLATAADEAGATEAALALGDLGAGGAPQLRRLLGSTAPRQRQRAAAALGNIGPTLDPESVQALARGLRDHDAGVRVACARALWQATPASGASRAALTGAAQGGDERVALWARRALAELPRPASRR